MAARRIAMLLSLVALPQVVAAQACNGLAYFKPNTRAMFVGGQADLVANANAFGALFGLTGGGAKAASLIADVRTIQYPGSSALGFGFTFDKAVVVKPTYEFCGFAGADMVSVSGSSSSAYQVGGSWGWTQAKNDTRLVMMIRAGLNFAIPSVGSTQTDVFSEVGLGFALANGLTIIPSYNSVYDGVSDGVIRIRATYPIGTRK